MQAQAAKTPAWHSGSHETNTAFVLHNQKKYSDEYKILNGVSLSTSLFSLKRMFQSKKNFSPIKTVLYPFRLLIGQFNWAPLELEKELGAGVWTYLPFNYDILFNVYYEDMWNICRAQINSESSNTHISYQTSWLQ